MEYSIKQVSEKTNLTSHTLRYYEKEGLLPFVKRTGSGIRRFSEDDLEWLSLICCLKNTGMSINQMREFVSLSMKGDKTLKQRCEILEAQKKSVEEQIETLQHHLKKVNHKIEHFSKEYKNYLNSQH